MDSRGYYATKKEVHNANKLFINNPLAEELKELIKFNNIKILNVAGNRMSMLTENELTIYRDILKNSLI